MLLLIVLVSPPATFFRRLWRPRNRPPPTATPLPADDDLQFLYPLKIVGVGHYLPKHVVSNAEIDRRGGFKEGTTDRGRSGVRERRRAAPGEQASDMAAAASRQALVSAGLRADQLDCIIGASGSAEQAIPDGAVLLQQKLGAQGCAAFSVHATCLSFFSALEVAGALIKSGTHDTILISSSEIASRNVDAFDSHTAGLFGDAAAAVVVARAAPGERCGIKRALFRTYSDGADLAVCRAGGTALPAFEVHDAGEAPQANPRYDYDAMTFQMKPRPIVSFTRAKFGDFLDELQPGLTKSEGFGDDGISLVVPHQASGLALDILSTQFGIPRERVMRNVLETAGNTIAASTPLVLYEAVSSGRARRGDEILLLGTGAGLSMAGIILVY
jgi:3-oxoacyl-[acyl-carrier-protein] synthase-3